MNIKNRFCGPRKQKAAIGADVQDKVDAYLSTIPHNYQNAFRLSAVEGKSKAAAIKAKCHNCVGYEDVVIRVRECKSYCCPLWRFRPNQVSKANEPTT